MQDARNARHGLVDANNATLVVLDIQSRLGEGMPAKVANRVIQNTILLAKTAAECAVPVIMTEQHPAMLGTTYSDIRAAIGENAPVVEKTCFSATHTDEFKAAMESHAAGRRQVILVGMEAHISVLQTALDLAADGREVFVIEDAVCSRRLENYQNALDRLRQNDVHVASAESVVFEWLRAQTHPAFAAVQNWLR